MKIVGSLMAHNEDFFIKKVLDDLSKYTDEIYVNLNDATEKVFDIVTNHPNVKKYIITENGHRWHQGKQRENAIRMLDDVKPDIVLIPDADETYPDNFQEILDNFISSDKQFIWFRIWYYWNNEKQIRNDGIYKSMHTCRAYKWEEGLSYSPYRGYCLPNGFKKKEERYAPNYPMHHWGYMRKEDRLYKFDRDGRAHYLNEDGIILLQVDELLNKLK